MKTKGETNYYTKTEVVDGQYIETSIQETVRVAVMVQDVETHATVTHTGAYGQIKVLIDGNVFTGDNPISNSFGNVVDKRLPENQFKGCKTNYLLKGKINDEVVVYSTNKMTFNLSLEKMSRLHYDLFITNHDPNKYWVEIPTDF